MSKREKTTIIFSRNGVKIQRTDFLDMTKYSNQENVGVCCVHNVSTAVYRKNSKTEIIQGKKAWDEVIKKESPLGFYYYHIVHHAEVKQQIIPDRYATANYRMYTFKFGDTKYRLSYPTACGDMKIDRSMRPWEILPGTTGMEDHFINALLKAVNKFFEVAESNKILWKTSTSKSIYNYDKGYEKLGWIGREKKRVMIDLFGDENGPTVTGNDIKILAHGFDLKESFRKRKES